MALTILKNAVREMFHSVGLDVHRHMPEASTSYRLMKSLERFDIDMVIDVGANAGQFAGALRRVGYAKDILSFEPLPEAYAALQQAATRDAKWRVHPRCAVGDSDGEIEINVSANSVSSSVLSMLEAHATAAPESAYVTKEKVAVVKLDTVLPEYINASRSVLLKIDTQGFEWEVLDGAQATIKNVKGVVCELSLVPLYEGQRLWTAMIDRLQQEGFGLWAIQTGFTDPRDGRTLQVDATFFRVDMPAFEHWPR